MTGKSASALAYSGTENHPWVKGYLDHCLDESVEPGRLDISADDEMFAYAIDACLHHRGHALVSYFRSGLLASQIVEQVLAQVLPQVGQGRDSLDILDFASGHGRSTRFITQSIDAGTLHVCEIAEGASAFQAERFGVRTVAPALKPGEFSPGRSFDAIFAFSFFSHLRRPRFEAWLETLWSSLADGGFLVFSTLGPGAMLPGRTFDPDGFFFEGVSESERLAIEDYGSAWVEERLVRQWIRRLEGAGEPVYQKQALWSLQDLWIVPRVGAAVSRVALEPLGFLDGARPASARKVELHGWAFDRSRGTAVEVEAFVNGIRRGATRADRARPDVAGLLAPAYPEFDAERTGWVLPVELDEPVRPDDFLVIEARPERGRSTVIHASSLEGAALLRAATQADQRARVELQHAEMTIHAMEQSRFWKLRNHWFAARSRLLG